MVDAVGTNSFVYTPVGQLASETGPWPSDTVSYLYSQMLRTNLTLSQSSGSWVQGYAYDNAWRMTSVVSPAGTFDYSYNFQPASSQVTGTTLPNGASITNSYDSLARLTQTALNNQWGHTLDGYTYTLDALGLRTNIVRNFGLMSSSVAVGYDKSGQITSWLAKEASGVPRLNEQLGFGYDAADNLHLRTNNALIQTFTLDAANELTNVSGTGTFTESGNTPDPAASVTVNGQIAQTNADFTFAATNLALLNGNNTFTNIAVNLYGILVTNTLTANLPVPDTLQYDQNGNLTNDGTRVFAYDAENELTNVIIGANESVFVYDGLGRRRIIRDYTKHGGVWVLTNEVHYIYDGYLPIQDRDTNNNVLVTYTRGLDLSRDLWDAGGIGGLLARTDTNGSTFYHSDVNGNITALMDTNENMVARYLYGPFGKLLGQWGSMAGVNEMQFSSMPHDNLSGLSLYPFRAYDANLQRWLNQDPLASHPLSLTLQRIDGNLISRQIPGELIAGPNNYRFVANNPLRYIDPHGLDQTILNPFYGQQVFGATGPQPFFVTVVTSNPQWMDDISDALQYPGTGVAGSEFEGLLTSAASEDANNLMARLMNEARKLYPKKCGKIQEHHITPKYLGGDPNGPTVPLEAPYHQLITNAFRNEWEYGQGPPESATTVINIVERVYINYPLPK